MLSQLFSRLAIAWGLTGSVALSVQAAPDATIPDFFGEDATMKDVEEYGDFMRYGVIGAGMLVSLGKGDDQGVQSLVESCVVTNVVVDVMKKLFNNTALGERPNGGEHSFPSGHVSGAMCGSAFLQHRYGGKYGGPAFAAASGVAASRYLLDKHHVRDVVTSTIISYLIADKMVKPYKNFGKHYGSEDFQNRDIEVPILSLKTEYEAESHVTFGILKDGKNGESVGGYVGFQMKF